MIYDGAYGNYYGGGHVYQKAIKFIKDFTKIILLFIRATSNGENVLNSTYVKWIQVLQSA